MSFSKRMGIVPEKAMQVGSMDDSLRNRLFNSLNSTFPKNPGYYSKYDNLRQYVLDKLGMNLDEVDNSNFNERFLKSEWYVPYDILELVLEYLTLPQESYNSFYSQVHPELREFVEDIQEVLQEEKSGYRLLNGESIPITNEQELESIAESTQTRFASVNTHMQKALSLYANRTAPDYENSIKESISAVEALCVTITGLTGKQATLGATIKRLKDSGVAVHGALETAFSNLYGYTSDENGIRHGGVDFKNAPAEDAKYMLVSCSAFVNYLIEKLAKSQGGVR
ncbi:MAG: hypothetical protein LBL86_06450 [Coriobacteriales bacterium]|jgi:hypothetical protein|nr:hypothetical protein [Coriobacteriales bacterium]